MREEPVMTHHPLIETLTRVRELAEHMETLKIAPEGDRWWSLQNLVLTTGEPLREIMGRVAAHHKVQKNRRVPASLFFGDCTFVLMALASGCYLLDRRVPRLTLDSVWFSFNEQGDVEGIALTDYRFTALDNDPASGHADCLVLPSSDALQEYLLGQASACLQALIYAVRANSTLGIPAMWALAADYTSSATAFVGRMMKDEEQALAFARHLAVRQTPLRRIRDFIHIAECGLTFDMVDRLSCCLYYQVEDGHYCSSCPHRPQDERIDMIKKWLAESAAKQQAAS